MQIRNKILGKHPINWRSLQFIQQPDFKQHTDENREKLKQSIKDNGFILPFNVWNDNGTNWCLDGYHRYQDLIDLEKEGVEIPDLLDALFIDCKDKEEAAKYVLLFSSQYATITQKGLDEFMQMYQLPITVLAQQTSLSILPENIPPVYKEPNIQEIQPQWYLNIRCESEQHCQQLYEEFTGKGFDVKIVS